MLNVILPALPAMIASIVMHDMDRSWYASYGYRSWMLQDMDEPYEIILCLFNNERVRFETLAAGGNRQCNAVIRTHAPPQFFNISAANNLGLHYAHGDYVLFANSDIIYPSHFLRTFVGELRRRDIHYAEGSRVNLSREQTRALADATEYGCDDNFDFLVGQEHRPGRVLGLRSSPWVVRRETAYQVGGFDPRVHCHEEADFSDRVKHYLRRRRLQDCVYGVTDLFGYHLSHPASELYKVSYEAKAILEPRRLRLGRNPDSEEDVMATELDSLASLEKDLYGTEPPPVAAKWRPRRVLNSALRRSRDAWNVLVHG